MKRGHGREGFGCVVGGRRWREEDARVALEEWSRSGLGLQEFARSHGLSRERLGRWVKRLGLVPGLRFHPVEVRPDRALPNTPPETSIGEGGVAVVLRGGRRVAVGRDFDEELLARVVRVVESWC